MTNTSNCLIRQSDCGLQSGQTECPKCGIRTDVRYVSQEDLDMAVAKGTALYWQNHAQAMERTIAAQEKTQREQLERAEIERAKAESARLQAQKEKQEAEARRAQEKAQREAAEQTAAQEKAKREQLERAEIERAKAESARLQAQKEKQEAEARRAQEKAQREAAEQRAAQEKVQREQLERANAKEANRQAEIEGLAQAEKQRLAAEQARRNPGQVFQDHPIAPQMVVLPSGSYWMGLQNVHKFLVVSFLPNYYQNILDESPRHEVTIDYKFAIGRCTVTFEEWDAYVADSGIDSVRNDSNWGRGKRPVINVSWNNAQSYIAWLNKKMGIAPNNPHRYRLPSEAEWEYACRAGSQTKFCFGDDKAHLKEYAWYSENSGNQTHPVGQKKANAFGLHDMHGNVKEWVQDCAQSGYDNVPSNGEAWEGPENRNERVLRGGSWAADAKYTQSADRDILRRDNGSNCSGFRLARTLP